MIRKLKIQSLAILAFWGIALILFFSYLKGPELIETKHIEPTNNSWLKYSGILSNNGESIGEGSGVDIDSSGNIYFLHRAGFSFSNNETIDQDVVIVYSRKTHEIIKTWGRGVFKSPHGITISNNEVWITDIILNKIFKFDLEGKLIQTYGKDYPFYLETCLRIRNKIVILPCIAPEPWYARPTDVEIFRDGTFVVSDGYRNSRLIKQKADGSIVWKIGNIGNRNGEFYLPHGLTKDAEENIYVADRRNARIQIFDKNGKWKSTWSDSYIGRPYSLDFSEGHIWVVDAGDSYEYQGGIERSRVLKLTLKGDIVGHYSAFGNKPGELRLPHDIAVSPQDDVYIAEIVNKRIQVFRDVSSASPE